MKMEMEMKMERIIKPVYERAMRPVLLELAHNDPEKLHNMFLAGLHQIGRREGLVEIIERALAFEDPALKQEIWGLDFPLIGMAAGFDKNGIAIRTIAALGVFPEVGTVTSLPQPGYERERIWYLLKEKALVNRMGFPNDGSSIIAGRLEKTGPISVPLIVNIGKGINTRIEKAVYDYIYCLQKFYPCSNVSAFSVNLSCPHMLGLRELRSELYFRDLISALQEKITDLASQIGLPKKPLLVKISPDDSKKELEKLLDVCLDLGVDGIIAVNTASTTLFKEGINAPVDRLCGKSGKPLFKKTVNTVGYISDYTQGKIPIMGVGGIFDAPGAYEMFQAGAWLIQILTGYIYHIYNFWYFYSIKQGLRELMDRDGVKKLSDLRK